MAFGTCRKPPPLRFWGASRFRHRAGPDLRKHRPNAFTAPPERIGPEPDLLCRLLRLRAFGVFPARLRAGLPAPSLAAKKPRSRRGCVAKRTKREKSTPIFPIILSQPDRFCQAFGLQREFPNCACCQGKPTQKEPICRNSPLFSPLFPQKNFSLTRLSGAPVRKRRRRPGQSAAFQKADFFLRPAHDKLHFARRLLFPFGRLPSAGKTDVCREFGEGGRLRGKFAAFPAFRALRLAGGERGNIMEEGPSGPGIGPERKGQNFSGPDGPNRRFL